MFYEMNVSDLNSLKQIGFDKLVKDLGDIIGSKFGGEEHDLVEARGWIRDSLNELSQQLDPENHEYFDDVE